MEGAIPRTEIERLFSAAKGLNTNLAQFLPQYHVIISNMDVCSFTFCMISHVHVHAHKTILCAPNLVYEKL